MIQLLVGITTIYQPLQTELIDSMLSEKDGFLNIPKDFYILDNFLVKEIFFSKKDKQTRIRAFISPSKQNQTTEHCFLFKRHFPPSPRMRKLAWERRGRECTGRECGVRTQLPSAVCCTAHTVHGAAEMHSPTRSIRPTGVLGYGQITTGTSRVTMNTQWLRDQADTEWMEISATPNAADGDTESLIQERESYCLSREARSTKPQSHMEKNSSLLIQGTRY